MKRNVGTGKRPMLKAIPIKVIFKMTLSTGMASRLIKMVS